MRIARRAGLALGAAPPYLDAMSLPRPASPRALFADLRTFARERSKVQWIAALVAVLMPIVIIVGFITDGRTNMAPRAQIQYIDSWSAKRTDAEIKAAQKQRQEENEAAAAERQRQFQELANRLGVE